VTDRGEVTAYTVGRRNVILLDSKVVLIDKNDNLYEIDLNNLDKNSLKLLAETV